MRAAAYSMQRLCREGWAGSVARPAALRGLEAARAALGGAGNTLEGDEALAERERFRVEDEARRRAQGCLRLTVVTE